MAIAPPVALLINPRILPSDPTVKAGPRTRRRERAGCPATRPLGKVAITDERICHLMSEPVGTDQAQSSISYPASRGRVLLFTLLAFAAGIGAAYWINQARFERLSGYLQARLQTITAGREARIARILVAPGTVVAPGQALVVLEDQELEQHVAAHRQEVESLEIELARTSAALEVELDIQRRDVLDRVFETKWRSAQLLRQQSLLPGEFVVSMRRRGDATPAPRGPMFLNFAEGSRQGKEGGEPTISAELALCNEHIAELERMNRELPGKISRSMGVDLVQARLQYAQGALAALERQQKSLTIVAGAAGLVGVFHKQAGEHVTPHEPIVQLLDEEQPFLMLQLPSPRIADFAPGTIVELRFPGGQKGKGRVESIPPQTSELPEEAGGPKETMITAQIDPVGKLWPEAPFGSVVEVRRRR